MIPFPPLDGSRLVYAIAPPALMDIMDKIEQYGLIAIFAFFFVFFRLISPYFTAIVGGISSAIIGQPVF